jgi:hypothetical protein
MGTTANRAIPYIEPSDALQTYPTQDKAQADRLDELLFDTGWVACTVQPGYVAQAIPPMVRRIGSVVYPRGGITSTGISPGGAHANVLTVPAGFRPILGTNAWLRAGTNIGACDCVWLIKDNGAVDCRPNPTAATYYLFTSGSWLIN